MTWGQQHTVVAYLESGHQVTLRSSVGCATSYQCGFSVLKCRIRMLFKEAALNLDEMTVNTAPRLCLAHSRHLTDATSFPKKTWNEAGDLLWKLSSTVQIVTFIFPVHIFIMTASLFYQLKTLSFSERKWQPDAQPLMSGVAGSRHCSRLLRTLISALFPPQHCPCNHLSQVPTFLAAICQ